jgi:hypothetical protein
MHSQPAVLFKRKTRSVAVTGFAALCLWVLIFLSFRWQSTILTATGVLLGLISIILWVRLLIYFARPYLHLTDNQVIVYNGLIPRANRHSLENVQSAHTNRPETYIELLGRDERESVRIDLHPLDKADRIRFIFLVESSINRKFSHKHR